LTRVTSGQPAHRECAGQTEHRSDGGQDHPLPEHQREDVARPSAQGHPHADLITTLSGRGGDDAIDAQCGEGQAVSTMMAVTADVLAIMRKP
jgi:hypothetical protein